MELSFDDIEVMPDGTLRVKHWMPAGEYQMSPELRDAYAKAQKPQSGEASASVDPAKAL